MKTDTLTLMTVRRTARNAALACGMLLLACGALYDARANTFSLHTDFDATDDGKLAEPYVGIGVISYAATEPLADGSYMWDSFERFSLRIDIQGSVFTEADLATSSEQVVIEIRGNRFFFSNQFGSGDGPDGGAADFVTDEGYRLRTEPYETKRGPLEGGGRESPLYQASVRAGNVRGTCGEPTACPRNRRSRSTR